MEERVWDYVCRHKMLEERDRVVVGVSGGADSVCLFWLLQEFRRRIPFEVCVVHVEHGIRGEEALADARFTEALCRREGVEYRLIRRPVPLLARQGGMSLEEAGRKVRYEAFEEVRKNWAGTKIAVAHHQNDQAETLLLNLFRGTGLKGMRGMEPVQGRIVRPLLCLEREEIEEWMSANGKDYRTDATNQEEVYTRNRIRHRILPEAVKVNRRAVEHLAAACEAAREAENYLSRETERVFSCTAREQDGELLLDAEVLLKEDVLIQKYVLREAFVRCAGRSRDLTAEHIGALLSLVNGGVGRCIHLPYGLCARKTYNGICVGRVHTSEKKKTQECGAEETLKVPGAVELAGGARVTLCLESCEKAQEIPLKTYTKWFDYDKIEGSLKLRTRRSGDYITVNDKGGRKKLKDYFIDEKIDREKRDGILLLADGSHILWVVGYRIGEAYKVTGGTKRILKVQVEGEDYYE